MQFAVSESMSQNQLLVHDTKTNDTDECHAGSDVGVQQGGESQAIARESQKQDSERIPLSIWMLLFYFFWLFQVVLWLFDTNVSVC